MVPTSPGHTHSHAHSASGCAPTGATAHTWRTLAVLLLLTCLCAFTRAQRTERLTLPNGMEVLVTPDTTLPLAHIEVSVLAGSLYERRTQHGISHLWQQTFWDLGADSLPQARQRRRQMGMVTHSWVQPEALQFSCTVLGDSLLPALAYLSNCLVRPVFDARLMEPARKAILRETDALERSPEWFLEEDIRQAFWGKGHRKQALGQFFRMRNLSEEDLYDHHQQVVRPGALRLAVAGRVTAAQVEEALMAAGLDMWGAGVKPEPSPRDTAKLQPPLPDAWLVSVNEFAGQPQLRISWVAPDPGADTEGYYAALVLATWINHPEHPLRMRLERGGLAIACMADYVPGHTAGIFTLRVTPVRDSLGRCLQAVMEEVAAGLGVGSLEGERWKMARAQVSHDLGMMAAVPTAWNHFLCQSWGLGVRLPEYTLEAVHALDEDAMGRLMAGYFTGRPLVCGVLVNSQQERSLDLAAAQARYQKLVAQYANAIAAAPTHHKDTLPAAVAVAAPAKASELAIQQAFEQVRIRFEVNALLPEGAFMDTLAQVGRRMQRHPSLRFFINSYTDSDGDGVKNYLLSVQRAEAIRDHLVQQYGIAPDRLQPRGYGEAFPEYNEKVKSEDAKNRRVTFTLQPPGGGAP